MTTRYEALKDITTTQLWFYPTEGRPSSTPSVELLDENGSTVTAASTDYVTQDTVNTTVATANSIGDKSIVLASVSGITVGKTYLLTNSLSQKEWVRVYGVDATNKIVYFDERIEYVHDTSATFQGCGFYRTLQSAEVDELKQDQIAEASYTVSSINYKARVYFDVVLITLDNPLTVEFLKKRRPDITGMEHDETLGSDFADLRETAWENVCKAIRAYGQDEPRRWRPALVRTPEGLDEWALRELDILLHENGVSVLRGDWDPRDAVDHLEERRNTAKMGALGSIRIDFNEDDTISEDETAPIRPDFVR